MNKQLQRLIDKMNKIKAQGENVKPYFERIKLSVKTTIEVAEQDESLTPATVRQLKTLQVCIDNAIERRVIANSIGEAFTGDNE